MQEQAAHLLRCKCMRTTAWMTTAANVFLAISLRSWCPLTYLHRCNTFQEPSLTRQMQTNLWHQQSNGAQDKAPEDRALNAESKRFVRRIPDLMFVCRRTLPLLAGEMWTILIYNFN